MSANTRGICFMLLFVLILPFNDAITKVLVAEYASSQLLALRFLLLVGFLLPPAMVLPAREMRRPAHRGLLLLRGVLIACASLFYVSSLAYLPLAMTTAISMMFPLIVTAVSPFFLGERVGVIRYSAVALGFVGAMLVIQPDSDGLGRGELLAMGAPLCFSVYIILTRRMSGSSSQFGQLFWTMLGALAVTVAVGAASWQPLDNFAWGMVLLTGVLALAIYMLQIAALSAGEASVIVPFSYLSLGTAGFVGWAIWGELPNDLAWAGIALIATSGVIVAVRS